MVLGKSTIKNGKNTTVWHGLSGFGAGQENLEMHAAQNGGQFTVFAQRKQALAVLHGAEQEILEFTLFQQWLSGFQNLLMIQQKHRYIRGNQHVIFVAGKAVAVGLQDRFSYISIGVVGRAVVF